MHVPTPTIKFAFERSNLCLNLLSHRIGWKRLGNMPRLFFRKYFGEVYEQLDQGGLCVTFKPRIDRRLWRNPRPLNGRLSTIHRIAIGGAEILGPSHFLLNKCPLGLLSRRVFNLFHGCKRLRQGTNRYLVHFHRLPWLVARHGASLRTETHWDPVDPVDEISLEIGVT